MNITRNRLVVGLLVAVGAIASITFATQSNAANTGDCSTNSIIKCGVTSMSDLKSKYNKSSELKALYRHYGMTSGHINGTSGKVRTGVVQYNGDVKVDGKTVATNAQSVGRNQNRGGDKFTVNGKAYYEGSTEERFVRGANLAAYVVFDDNGKFVAAVIKECGNPVDAKPKPQPKPQPKPSYACTGLTAQPIRSTDGKTTKFNFKASAKAANGAKVKNYTYNFGDGKKVTSDSSVSHTYAKAGTYTTTVTVNVTVNGTTKTDSGKECAVKVTVVVPEVKPADVRCSALNLEKISDERFNLEATATATAASNTQKAGVIKGYVFTIKNAEGETVKTIEKTTENTSAESGAFTLQPGSYTASVVVKSNVGDKTGQQCKVAFEVPAPKQIQVCRLSDYAIVTINEDEFDSSKHSKDVSDCEKVEVCDLTTNTIVSVNKEEAKSDRYTTDLSKCEKVEVCDTTTGEIVTVYPNQVDEDRYTTDLSKCEEAPVIPETPETPEKPEAPVAELPQTGAADLLLSVFGAGSLIAATSYYVASRRALS